MLRCNVDSSAAITPEDNSMHALTHADLLCQSEPSRPLGNELLQTHQQQRKAAGQDSKGTAPRFERLMDRLDLTDKERLAMLYVLVKQVSQEDFSNLFPKFGRSPPSFAAFAGLVSPGMLHNHLHHIMHSMFTTFASAQHHFADLVRPGVLPWHSTQLQHIRQGTLHAAISAPLWQTC